MKHGVSEWVLACVWFCIIQPSHAIQCPYFRVVLLPLRVTFIFTLKLDSLFISELLQPVVSRCTRALHHGDHRMSRDPLSWHVHLRWVHTAASDTMTSDVTSYERATDGYTWVLLELLRRMLALTSCRDCTGGRMKIIDDAMIGWSTWHRKQITTTNQFWVTKPSEGCTTTIANVKVDWLIDWVS